MSDVVVHTADGEEILFVNAYLQADDETVLIRQKKDGYWTTHVFAPGQYKEVMYVVNEDRVHISNVS